MENTTVKHPSYYLKPEWAETIRIHAPAAEKSGILHPEQLALIHQQQWLKLLVPAVYSGMETPLPAMVRMEEALSWADGSLGWVVTLCAGAAWFGGFLSPDIAPDVFTNPKVCLAGSGAVGGTAMVIEGGYLINGAWKYASGTHHATHITANCRIEKDGQPVLNDNGEPLILPFIFDRKDVNILPAWKYIGMVATGSDAFEVLNLKVAANRQFKIDPSALVVDGPLYHYPFLQLAEATLAANLSGMAIHFIDLCGDVFTEKAKQPRLTDAQKVFLTNEISGVKETMEALRANFYEALDQSWLSIEQNKIIPDELLGRVSVRSRKLAQFTRQGVDRLYPLCGLIAASTETEINRAWRDLHTASQHSLLTFEV